MEAVAHNPPALKQQRDRAQKRGFSLIEAAIVLAVVGGVIGGIWVSAAAVIENYKVKKTVEGILTTARNIQNLISITDSRGIGPSNMTFALISAGVFPKDWVNGNDVKTTFGWSVIAFNLQPPLVTTGDRFFLNLQPIPVSSCIKLTVSISSIGAMVGSHGNGAYQRIWLGYIGITPIQTGASPVYLNNFPISPEIAKTYCIGTMNQVEVGFDYNRIN